MGDQIIAKEGAKSADSLSKLLGIVTGKKDSGKEKEAAKAPKDEKKKKGSRKKGGDSDDEPEDTSVPETPDAVYHAAANDCHIFCRKVDKKREKAFASEGQAALREQLQEAVGWPKAVEGIEAMKLLRQHEDLPRIAREERQTCVLVFQLAMLQ